MGWMDGWMDGWTDRQTDGQRDEKYKNILNIFTSLQDTFSNFPFTTITNHEPNTN